MRFESSNLVYIPFFLLIPVYRKSYDNLIINWFWYHFVYSYCSKIYRSLGKSHGYTIADSIVSKWFCTCICIFHLWIWKQWIRKKENIVLPYTQGNAFNISCRHLTPPHPDKYQLGPTDSHNPLSTTLICLDDIFFTNILFWFNPMHKSYINNSFLIQ